MKKSAPPSRKTKRKAGTEPKRHGVHRHQRHAPKKRPLSAVRAQPLIAVRDVEASSRWYAQLLGARSDGAETHQTHGNLYDRVLSRGRLVLQLHAWDRENHPNLVGVGAAPLGHGLLLWFELDDFDAAVERARALGAHVVEEPHVNPGPRHREMWLRDPDGYVVVICSPDGEVR
jgi:catechol 2,3-dioxygenase-like lactoylglutathione lyase family enzyme